MAYVAQLTRKCSRQGVLESFHLATDEFEKSCSRQGAICKLSLLLFAADHACVPQKCCSWVEVGGGVAGVCELFGVINLNRVRLYVNKTQDVLFD
jgi:hypothetical protein